MTAAGDARVDAAGREATLLAEALELIDLHGCTTFWGGSRCFDRGSGRTRGASEGARAWCDACIARDALNAWSEGS